MRTASSYDPLDFSPPDVNLVSVLLAPQRLYHRPVCQGLSHLRADKPTLYVGNHTIFGVMDAPLILEQIYRATGVMPRALADHMHYLIPGWRDMLHRFGVVDGTRENCRKLMGAGHPVLVFPGGGREVAKRKGEAYELAWKQRVGFVRMAVEHGYSITPFASVGPEECYSIRIDANDLRALPVWKWLKKTPLYTASRQGEMIMPFATGWLGSPLPRRERFHFAFGEPVSTDDYRGRETDDAALLELQALVRTRVETLIKTVRSARPDQ